MISFESLAYSEDIERLLEQARQKECSEDKILEPARVISLDRGFPLVVSPSFEGRSELSTTIKKSDDSIVAIGDWVALWRPSGHEKAVIETVLPRKNEIARVKRVGREKQVKRQVLAANVDDVFICHSLSGEGIDEPLLMRQMVAVAGCNAQPVFVLTKSDVVDAQTIERTCASIRELAPEVLLFVISEFDPSSIEALRMSIRPEQTVMLLGESGVGKSSLVNALLGEQVLQVGAVRDADDKGRHTTVARRLIPLPGGGLIIDAPGLRTLQIIDKPASLKAAFPDISNNALACRFRDCTHTDEPGCAVREEVPARRLEAFRRIAASAI